MTEYARRASSDDASFYGGAIAFTEELKSYLVTPDFRKISRTSGNVANYYLDSNTSPANTLNTIEYLRKIIYMEFKNRLPELLLMRVDKMSMAASVEARVPFLDHRLVEFAYRIPGSLKVKNGITKYILKKAAEGIIPNDIIYRKKQGFAAPIRQWLRTGKLRKFTRDRIFDSDLMKLNLFRSDFIDTMLRDHQIGKNNFDRELWSLLLVCMWYDAFIARKDH